MIKSFHYSPREESVKDFTNRLCASLYPEGAKHCMMHCKFTTGYEDGSGAYCNNKNSSDYQERVRSWDTVGNCPYFDEGDRIKEHD